MAFKYFLFSILLEFTLSYPHRKEKNPHSLILRKVFISFCELDSDILVVLVHEKLVFHMDGHLNSYVNFFDRLAPERFQTERGFAKRQKLSTVSVARTVLVALVPHINKQDLFLVISLSTANLCSVIKLLFDMQII